MSEPDANRLPEYAAELSAFHQAFAGELKAIVDSLPILPNMRVLDVGCGDGFYLGWLAARLTAEGAAVGLDANKAYLKLAAEQPRLKQVECRVEFVSGDLSNFPAEAASFDFVWCAQSLYSLPTPVEALEQMAKTLRPGGLIAVLENDTLHQVLLPWPCELEIALRAAEFVVFTETVARPSKYYVGRRLPALFAEAGLEPLSFRTQCIDRRSPLEPSLQEFLQAYLARLAQRANKHLDPLFVDELSQLIDPASPRYLLSEPHFTMSWLNVLAIGRKPVGA